MKTKLKILITSMAVLMLLVGITGAASANPVTGAVSTTHNPDWPDTYDSYVNQACLNGNGVNCNIYLDKRDVWLSGLPNQAAVGAGNYFFAVLVPGGQGGHDNPNDGTPKNLSDDFDTYANRSFTVDGSGVIGYSGTHDFDSANNKLQMFPYADTTNPGGVYILAVCSLDGALNPEKFGEPGVDPRDCKYDAFKIKQQVAGPEPLSVIKDAEGSFDREFSWGIDKTVAAPTEVKTDAGLPVTFNYTVTVTHDAGTDSNIVVSGTITVLNPNKDAVTGDLDDSINDPSAICYIEVDGIWMPSPVTGLSFPLGASYWPYQCTYTATPQSLTETNNVKVSWPEQELSNGTLLAGDEPFSFEFTFSVNLIDECTTVNDSNPNGPQNVVVCVGDAGDVNGTFTFKYSASFNGPAAGTCVDYPNTATSTPNDGGKPDSASASVTVCSYKARLTPGYWKNHLKYDPKNPTLPYTFAYLPQLLGAYNVDTTTKATAVWNAMNCSNTGSNTQLNQNAIGCLAGHLLAAKLNVANGANTCISPVISSSDTFLISIPYIGPSGNYTGIGAIKRNTAIGLKNSLDAYNNGGYCH